MKYDSALGQSLPLILANDAAAFRRQRALRRFGTAIMVLTATAVGTAAMAVEDPMAPLVAVSASFIDVAASMSNQTMFRTAAAAPSNLSADNEGLTRIATAAAAEPAYRNQAEMSAGSPGSLLNQFVAWSQDQQQLEQIEAQARQQPAAEPATFAAAQDNPTLAMAEASEPLRVTPTPQDAERRIRNARAELPPTRLDHAATLHAPHASAKPAEKPQAQNAPVHDARPQSLLQMLGWRG
jgi:hypothetical protein